MNLFLPLGTRRHSSMGTKDKPFTSEWVPRRLAKCVISVSWWRVLFLNALLEQYCHTGSFSSFWCWVVVTLPRASDKLDALWFPKRKIQSCLPNLFDPSTLSWEHLPNESRVEHTLGNADLLLSSDQSAGRDLVCLVMWALAFSRRVT